MTLTRLRQLTYYSWPFSTMGAIWKTRLLPWSFYAVLYENTINWIEKVPSLCLDTVGLLTLLAFGSDQKKYKVCYNSKAEAMNGFDNGKIRDLWSVVTRNMLTKTTSLLHRLL